MTLTRGVAHGEEQAHFKYGTIFGWRAFFRCLWLRLTRRHIAEVKGLDWRRKSEIRHWTERERRLENINTCVEPQVNADQRTGGPEIGPG